MEQDANETRKIAGNWREYLDESKETFRVYAWAWREFITPKSRAWMKRGVIALLAFTTLIMLEPLAIKAVIDGLVAKNGPTVVRFLALVLGVRLAAEACLISFLRYRERSLGEDQGHLDVRTTELFLQQSLGQHQQDTGGLNAANVEKGRNRVLEAEHMLVFDGVPLVAELLMAFAFLWYAAPIAGAVMTSLLLLYVVVGLYLNRHVLVECTPIDAQLRAFNRYRTERWENVERVKTNGKDRAETAHMRSWFADVLAKDRKFWLWFIGMTGRRGLVNVTVSAGVAAYGAWLVWNGTWSVGYLYPFLMWVGAIGRNLWRIGFIEQRLNWSMPSVRSMMLALTQKPAVVDALNAEPVSSEQPLHVECRELGHAYGEAAAKGGDATRMHVLGNVSFTVEPGEKVALLGPSGAGKTTVMRLLQRYMDPERGSVRVNGRDLRELELESWQRLVGYIPQQAQVLDGTLRYNLLYGLPESERDSVTDEHLWDVMRTLQIDFGERLTQGLDTVVGRRGIRLSGGQAQRLMIGAAVLKRPRFMVIDEATSSLDSTTEKAVQAGLARLLPAETSALIITHRLSTVRSLCTKFVVLRSAEEAKAAGVPQVEAVARSFEELARISPTFRRLAADQDVEFGVSQDQSPTEPFVAAQ